MGMIRHELSFPGTRLWLVISTLIRAYYAMKSIRTITLLLCLLGIGFCCLRLWGLESERRALKEDMIELSNIKYGLFSIDEWKVIVATIITKKIEGLSLSDHQRQELRVKIEGFLNKTLDDFRDRFYEEKSKTPWGVLQGGIASLIGAFNKMKDDVPVFTDQIIVFMDDTRNRDLVKSYLLEKFSKYTDQTFSDMDYTRHNQILEHYAMGDRAQTIEGLQVEINKVKYHERLYVIIAFLLFAVVAGIVLFSKHFTRLEYWAGILICLFLLLSGLFLPMIEIDARIGKMGFTLFGEPVSFTEQVLYYRSKSILEVVNVMVQQSRTDIKLVGFLVLLFSVMFPLMKLISTGLVLNRPALENNKFMKFMVFRTGKWSMADVMVVAIFMSYIGFSGILTEQLKSIENISKQLEIVTTNNSSLQIGFFLFTAFVILSLMLTHKFQYAERNHGLTATPKAKAGS
jgi:hypothetical protein